MNRLGGILFQSEPRSDARPLGLSVVVAESGWVATLPRHISATLVESGHELRLVPCQFPIPEFNVYQYWHVRADHDPGNIWLRDIVSDAFKGRDVFGPDTGAGANPD